MKRKGNGSGRDIVLHERPNTAILYAAYEFHDAAKLLHGTQRSRSRLLTFESAAAVNAAFALELYIKSLNAARIVSDEPFHIDDLVEFPERDVSRTRGHSLVVLFAALDTDLRQHLASAYGCMPASDRIPTLESALTMYDRAFETGRYHFETVDHETVDTDALFRLLDFFRAAMETLPRPK